jgi:hypothetical protein
MDGVLPSFDEFSRDLGDLLMPEAALQMPSVARPLLRLPQRRQPRRDTLIPQTSDLTVAIICVACVLLVIAAVGFGLAVANAARKPTCDGQTGGVGASDAHGWWDCGSNQLVCDQGYHSDGKQCVAGGPPPPPPGQRCHTNADCAHVADKPVCNQHTHKCVAGGGKNVSALVGPAAATGAAATDIVAYTKTLYPAATASFTKGGPELWRTLDLFYTGSCIAATKAVTSGPNAGTVLSTPAGSVDWAQAAEPNSLRVLREILKAYQAAAQFTPGAASRFKVTTTSATSTKAACISWDITLPTGTFFPAKYEPVELPLAEQWTKTDEGSFLAALSINRYSPAADPLRMSDKGDLGYCVTGSGVTEKRPIPTVPGISQYLFRDGLKSGAWVEISHVDTRYKAGEGQAALDYYSYEDGLSNQCENTSHSHGVFGGTGSGHYHYVTNGSGIWLNLGITEVAQNKVDSMRHILNNWDGRNRTVDSTNKSTFTQVFTNPSNGKLADTTSLATWLAYVKAATGDWMSAAIYESCAPIHCTTNNDCKDLTSTPVCNQTTHACATTLNAPTYVSTFKDNDGTDQNLAAGQSITDVLQLGSQAFYRLPCMTTGGTGYCTLPGLYFSNGIPPFNPTSGLFFWGAFAPLVPKSLFSSKTGAVPATPAAVLAERQKLLSWILWACVNGYDFATNAHLHTPPVAALFANKTASQQDVQNQRLNAFLSNFANTPYNQDDFLLQYSFNKGLDTFQLVRSPTEALQYNFELIAFTGTVDASKAKTTTWNCSTPGDDPVYFTRNPLVAADPGVRMKAIVDGGSCNSWSDCPGLVDCTAGKCQSRYLNANPIHGVSYNIGHPISMPYYANSPMTIPKCSDLSSPCSGGPPPSPPSPGQIGIGDACTNHSSCPQGSACQAGFCAYTGSHPCPPGQCQTCGVPAGNVSSDCPAPKSGYPAGCYSSKSSKCQSAGKSGNTCTVDCPCYLCNCSVATDCPGNGNQTCVGGKCHCTADSNCPSGLTCKSGQCSS